MNIPVALLDANVLYSAALRDTLLSIAERELFVPLWTNQIQEEWIRNLLVNRTDIPAENHARCRRQMDEYFPHALVDGYEHLIPTLEMSDEDDRHVLAAAIHAEADTIVTFNLRHFREEELEPHGIEAVNPDLFLCDLLRGDFFKVCEALREQRLSLKKPTKTVEQFLTKLRVCGLDDFADKLLQLGEPFKESHPELL